MKDKVTVLMRKYEVGRLLGQGTFAKVYHARSIKTEQSVAIKVIDKEKVTKAGLVDQIKREISILRLVRHPNIVQLYEVMATKTKIYFVMEYVKGGELFNEVAKGKLKEDVAQKYFCQLISAVDYFHSRGVYHRDLKPENLLLDDNENLKVSDFGLSACAGSKRMDGLLHTICGTPAYVAPEVINRKGYDGAKADIWSCGVILYVLLAGYLPFHDSNLMELYNKIGRAEFRCPSWFASETRKLLVRILDPNPLTRISIAKIMQNSWVRRGREDKQRKHETKSKEVVPVDPDEAFSSVGGSLSEVKQELVIPRNLNAFDIIALSSGFDLSALFEEVDHQKEARFMSKQQTPDIVSRMEEITKILNFKMKKDGGIMKIEGSKKAERGH